MGCSLVDGQTNLSWMDGWMAGRRVGWMDGWIHGRRLVFHKICRLQSRLLNGRELEKKVRRGRQCIAGWRRDDGIVGEAEKRRAKEDQGKRERTCLYIRRDPQYC